jgi:type I restriction enzyme R subunit
MNMALSGHEEDEEEDFEDKVNRIIESKRLLPNASYFAFTATPKNKTLELFGDLPPGMIPTTILGFVQFLLLARLGAGA